MTQKRATKRANDAKSMRKRKLRNKQTITRTSKCNNKHSYDDDDEAGDNNAGGIQHSWGGTPLCRSLPPLWSADTVLWLLFLVGVSVSGPLGASLLLLLSPTHFLQRPGGGDAGGDSDMCPPDTMERNNLSIAGLCNMDGHASQGGRRHSVQMQAQSMSVAGICWSSGLQISLWDKKLWYCMELGILTLTLY